MPIHPDTQGVALHAAANDDQSTHSSAAQASAVFVLRHLHGLYPHIPAASPTHQNAQGVLITNLQELINHLEEKAGQPARDLETLARDRNYLFHQTAQIILHIAAESSVFSAENKIGVLKQLLKIAKTTPGFQWTEEDAQWSQNKWYNADTKRDEMFLSSPAETLNLVCCVLLDVRQFKVALGKTPAENLSDRILPLANALLKMFLAERAGNFETCAAGRQHEMLHALNEMLLINGKPITFLTDTPSFLFLKLTSFIRREIESLPSDDQRGLMSDWVLHYAGINTREISPPIEMLRKRYPAQTADEVWKKKCIEFLIAELARYGVNPARYIQQINLCVDSVSDLQPLCVEASMLAAICSAPLLENSPLVPFSGVVQKRNQALVAFKEKMKDGSFHSEKIRDFFTAEEVFQRIFVNSRDLLLINIGDYQNELANVIARLIYFYEFGSFQDDFTLCTDLYAQKERELKAHLDQIENFFVIPGSITEKLNKLRELQKGSQERHPFFLTDEELEAWLVPSAETSRLPRKAYKVNRIILHALLTQSSQWSDLFCAELAKLTSWIIKLSERDSVSRVNFKTVYPRWLIANLMLVNPKNPCQGDAFRSLLIALSHPTTVGVDKGKNAFRGWLDALSLACEDEQDDAVKISDALFLLITKCDAAYCVELIKALSVTDQEGPSKGMNAFWAWISALIWAAQNKQDVAVNISDALFLLIKKSDVASCGELIKGFSQGVYQDRSVFWLLLASLNTAPSDKKEVIVKNVSEAFSELMTRCDARYCYELIRVLSIQDQYSQTKGINAFLYLLRAFHWSVKNKQDASVKNICDALSALIRKSNTVFVRNLIHALSRADEHGRRVGENAFWHLFSGLYLAAKNNQVQVVKNTFVVLCELIEKCNDSDCGSLTVGLSVPNKENDISAFSFFSKLIHFAINNQDELLENIYDVLSRFFDRCSHISCYGLIKGLSGGNKEGIKTVFLMCLRAVRLFPENKQTEIARKISAALFLLIEKSDAASCGVLISGLSESVQEGTNGFWSWLYILYSVVGYNKDDVDLVKNIPAVLSLLIDKSDDPSCGLLVKGLSEVAQEGPHKGKNAFWFLLKMLDWAAYYNRIDHVYNETDNVDALRSVSALFSRLIRICNVSSSGELIMGLSELAQEGENKGRNAFWFWLSMLYSKLSNIPFHVDHVKNFSALISRLISKCDISSCGELIKGFSKTDQEGANKGKNAFWLWFGTLDLVAQDKRVDVLKNISAVLLLIIRRSDAASFFELIKGLSEVAKKGLDKGKNAFWFLFRVLHYACQYKQVDAVKNISADLSQLIARCDPVSFGQLIKGLSESTQKEPDKGFNCFWLWFGGLSWAVRNNQDEAVKSISAAFSQLIAKCDAASCGDLIKGLSKTVQDEPNKDKSAFYPWLIALKDESVNEAATPSSARALLYSLIDCAKRCGCDALLRGELNKLRSDKYVGVTVQEILNNPLQQAILGPGMFQNNEVPAAEVSREINHAPTCA